MPGRGCPHCDLRDCHAVHAPRCAPLQRAGHRGARAAGRSCASVHDALACSGYTPHTTQCTARSRMQSLRSTGGRPMRMVPLLAPRVALRQSNTQHGGPHPFPESSMSGRQIPNYSAAQELQGSTQSMNAAKQV
eukprot:scaffold66312_cov23-Tisochrysis_lutea.AAC.1